MNENAIWFPLNSTYLKTVLGLVDPRDQRDQRDQRMQREETWNTVPMTKNSRTIDPTKIPKISKVRRAASLWPQFSPSTTGGLHTCSSVQPVQTKAKKEYSAACLVLVWSPFHFDISGKVPALTYGCAYMLPWLPHKLHKSYTDCFLDGSQSADRFNFKLSV